MAGLTDLVSFNGGPRLGVLLRAVGFLVEGHHVVSRRVVVGVGVDVVIVR